MSEPLLKITPFILNGKSACSIKFSGANEPVIVTEPQTMILKYVSSLGDYSYDLEWIEVPIEDNETS